MLLVIISLIVCRSSVEIMHGVLDSHFIDEMLYA